MGALYGDRDQLVVGPWQKDDQGYQDVRGQ